MDETTSPGRSEAYHKTRRPHRKSRYGCTRCKKRRIKCDELTPRCSRCKKMNLTCQYSTTQPGSRASDDYCIEPVHPMLMQLEVFPIDCGAGSPESSDHLSAIAGSPLSSVSSVHSSQPLLPLQRPGKMIDSPLRSQAAQTLAPIEFELFKHYLEHTSRDPTVDDGDRYTLQIGIPNLACQSTPLMKSVLALAAVCKCCDIINKQSVSHEDRGQVVELLSLAHQYHMESLRDIQATLPEAEHYDHILANAAMMGMYGSGSHCIRIWLAKTATFADQPPRDSMPKYSQWISLFRAVHIAYNGLLNNTLGTNDVAELNPARPPAAPMAGGSLRVPYEYKVSSYRVERPRASTDHVLGPIMAATVGSALKRLHEKVSDIVTLHTSNDEGVHRDSKTPTTHGTPQLQACVTALGIFKDIVAETFPAGDSMPSTLSHSHIAYEVDNNQAGQLSEVSPWLRRYTASITSTIPSALPRRTIMAFVHKVPTSYLNLVEDMISFIQAEAPSGTETAWGSLASVTLEPSIEHQLAMEIFAHWLVLLILLDNVWWIGCIGAWELSRVVFFKNDVERRICLWDKDGDWWPENMLEVSRKLDKHRTKGGTSN